MQASDYGGKGSLCWKLEKGRSHCVERCYLPHFVSHLLRANAIKRIPTKGNSGIAEFSFWRQARAVLLTAIYFMGYCAIQVPFCTRVSREPSCCGDLLPAGQGVFFVTCLWWDRKQCGLVLTLNGNENKDKWLHTAKVLCLLSVPLLP